jgi:hypothetical protein
MATCFGGSWFKMSISALIFDPFPYLVSILNACVHWFLKKPGMHHSMQRGSMARVEVILPQSKGSQPNCRITSDT